MERNYYQINENMARRAHEMMSFSDYKEGSKTSEYRQLVDNAYELAEEKMRRVDTMYHEQIERLADTYSRKLAENMNDSSRIGCMCPSVMIAGPANFPVKKKERQNAADRKNIEEYRKIQGLLDKIRSIGTGGISADDPNAIEKLKRKIESLERRQELMKNANAAIRMKNEAEGDKRLAELGYYPEEIRALREPDFAGRIGYPAYELTNNNANIRRLKARLAELEKRREAPADGWEFEGGRVAINTELNRLQIFFDEKPDEDTRTNLKSNGFRWAPSQGAWQRQYTDNALRAAKIVTGKR